MVRLWIVVLALVAAPVLIQCSESPEPAPQTYTPPPPPRSPAQERFERLAAASSAGDAERFVIHRLEGGRGTTIYGRAGRWLAQCHVWGPGRWEGNRRCSMQPTSGRLDRNRLSLLRYEWYRNAPEFTFSHPHRLGQAVDHRPYVDLQRGESWQITCAGVPPSADQNVEDFVAASLLAGRSCVTLAEVGGNVHTTPLDPEGFADTLAFVSLYMRNGITPTADDVVTD